MFYTALTISHTLWRQNDWKLNDDISNSAYLSLVTNSPSAICSFDVNSLLKCWCVSEVAVILNFFSNMSAPRFLHVLYPAVDWWDVTVSEVRQLDGILTVQEYTNSHPLTACLVNGDNWQLLKWSLGWACDERQRSCLTAGVQFLWDDCFLWHIILLRIRCSWRTSNGL